MDQRKEKFLLAVDMVVTKSHKRKKACSPMSCPLLLIVYYVSTFRHYFTSSNINTTVYQCIINTRERFGNLLRAVKANNNRKQ